MVRNGLSSCFARCAALLSLGGALGAGAWFAPDFFRMANDRPDYALGAGLAALAAASLCLSFSRPVLALLTPVPDEVPESGPRP